jgi:chaperonin GroES
MSAATNYFGAVSGSVAFRFIDRGLRANRDFGFADYDISANDGPEQARRTTTPAVRSPPSELFRLRQEIHMNFRPLHDRVLVKRVEEQESVRNGIIIPDSAREKPHEAEVIAVGDGKLDENGERMKIAVKAGDKILFGKYSGSDIKVDGQEFLILREDEILGVFGNA